MIRKKQKEVLDFIKSFKSQKSYSPSLEEIKNHFGFKSVSTAHYHLEKLEEEGYLSKGINSSRSIEVKSPEIQESSIRSIPESISLPVLGSANAGPATIFATENPEGYVKVLKDRVDEKKRYFVLRIEGDSMNQANVDGNNLEDGDFVIVDPEAKTPEGGDYVLSVIDGCANVKKYKEEDGQRMLVSESTNPDHKPIYLSSEDNFMINGKIIGVIKK